jgi:subtilase family serine protease
VLPVKLADGVHKLTVTLDPYAKTQESDENNNSFTLTVVVRG